VASHGARVASATFSHDERNHAARERQQQRTRVNLRPAGHIVEEGQGGSHDLLLASEGMIAGRIARLRWLASFFGSSRFCSARFAVVLQAQADLDFVAGDAEQIRRDQSMRGLFNVVLDSHVVRGRPKL
jgi:hypothetical protein